MLVVIPVSSEDAAVTPEFSEVLRSFGPYPNHEAMIVAQPSDQPKADALFQELNNLFKNVSVHVFSQDGPTSSPQSLNYCWFHAAHYLQFDKQNTMPWLWLGSKATPLRKGWLDSIEVEYNLAKMPFWGAFADTELVAEDGTKTSEGQHLVRTAVFPPNFLSFSSLASHSSHFPVTFEVFCQWEMAGRAHGTSLVQFGEGPVRPDAVLFHGVLSEKPPQISDKTREDSEAPLNVDVLIPKRRRAAVAA